MSFAKVICVGRVGATPELRHTAAGKPVTDFSIALNRKYRDDDGNHVEQTDWEKVVAFGRLAETITRYVGKGRRVYVAGHLQTRSYEPQEGQRRWVTEIVADQVEFLDSPNGNGDSAQTE